jgi:hypothetical protein
MSDAVDEHLDKAFASLDDVPVRELMATSEALERRKDGLRGFANFFRNVAHARGGGRGTDLPRFHLGQGRLPRRRGVRRADLGGRGTLLGARARRAGRAASVTPRPSGPLRGLVTAAETSPLANRVSRTACRDVAMTGATQACRFHGGSRGSEANRDVRAFG